MVLWLDHGRRGPVPELNHRRNPELHAPGDEMAAATPDSPADVQRHKPTRLVIRMHLRVNEFGLPAGRGRKADYRLRKARIAGRRTWIAGFYGRRKARRHLYLAVDVFYRDVEGCGGPQHMALAFHLRRRPP